MSFALSNVANYAYMNYIAQQNKSANTSNNIGFTNILSTKSVANTAKAEQSFEDMWKSRFPGSYYHTMDAYKISQDVWEREDFPFEKFFQDEVDNSILEWQPVGKNPDMTDSQVQARLRSIRGQKSIVVPPALEEKMNSDPALAERVMAKVENFIVTDAAMTPDRICSYLIVLDENGEIARFRASSGGGNISGPTEEEQRQFEAEQAEKRKRREEYARLNEESALKRKLQEQEEDRRSYQRSIAKEAALEAYQSSFITSEVNIL